jgi:hypothetical protein
MESSSSAVSVSPTSYDDVTQKLSQLFANELTRIHGITEVGKMIMKCMYACCYHPSH